MQEKLRLKEEKMEAETKYMYALVDGRKEKVGNFRVEPPGLFRGRGEHPKMGKLKARIYPRDITINIGKGVPIPSHPYPDQRCGALARVFGGLMPWLEPKFHNISLLSLHSFARMPC
jgi:DNA topoisomerase IB